MTPLQRYQSDIQKNRIKKDDKQWQAVQCTQRLYSELDISEQKKTNLLENIFRKNKEPVKGLYLWAGQEEVKHIWLIAFMSAYQEI